MSKQLLAQQPRNIFAQQEVERADAELNRVYSRVKSALAAKPSTLAALKKAQNAWIAFRTTDAEAEYVAFGKGSGQPEVGGAREALLTRERSAGLLLILAGPAVLGDGKDLKEADVLLNQLWKGVLGMDTRDDAAEEAKVHAKRAAAQRNWIVFRDAELALWKTLGARPTAMSARLTWERCRHLNQ